MMPEESILIRFHEGEATPEESAMVTAWLEKSADHRTTFETTVAIWEHAAHAKQFQEINLSEEWEQLKAKAGPQATVRPMKSRFAWRHIGWAAVAAVLLLVLISGIRSWTQQQPNTTWQVAQSLPDADQALALSLADGTHIWLNRDSKLEYPASFDGKERLVRLEGEAYFEVAKNPEKPFVVLAGKSKTEVLGTAFNLSAYEEIGEVLLSVQEGKVRFSSTFLKGGEAILTATQQARIDPAGQLERIEEALHPNTLSWKTGKLIFEESPLWKVLLAVGHQYQVAIRWADASEGKDCAITTTFEGGELQDILEELAAIAGLRYQQTATEILVEGACEAK